jgi:hypothetical protein
MADLGAIREALATQISTVPGLRVSATYVSVVNPPAAVIMPQPGQIIQFMTMDGLINYNLRIILLVTMASDTSSQEEMDDLMSTTGLGTSVLDAINADPSLGGSVAWALPSTMTTYGLIEWAGVQYFGTNILVTVAE